MNGRCQQTADQIAAVLPGSKRTRIEQQLDEVAQCPDVPEWVQAVAYVAKMEMLRLRGLAGDS
jgi:hypothetical protein